MRFKVSRIQFSAPSKQEVLPSMICGKQATQPGHSLADPRWDTPALYLSSLPPSLSSESIATLGVYRPDLSKEAAKRESLHAHLRKIRDRDSANPTRTWTEVRVLDSKKNERARRPGLREEASGCLSSFLGAFVLRNPRSGVVRPSSKNSI